MCVWDTDGTVLGQSSISLRGVGNGKRRARLAGGGGAMFVEDVEEDPDVLEASVHALAVKGDHGVGSIADDYCRGGVMIRLALDADEGQMGVLVEGGDELLALD